MNFKYIINSKILFFICLLVSKTALGQECSSDGINCISCTEYRNCNTGFFKERVISCTAGVACADDQLKQCQMKLNCYALNECIQAGIFADVMVDSNYYVCLSDTSSGFLKYEFTCPEGNFFDKVSLTCMSREITLAATEVPSSSTSADPTSPSISTDTTSPSLSTDPTSPSVSTDPTSPSVSTDPTSPSVSTDPTSPSVSTDPTSPSVSTDPTSPSVSTDPTSPSVSTDPTSPSVSTDPTSPSVSTDPTSPSVSTDPTSSPSSTTPTSSTTPPVPRPTITPFACMASGIFPNPDNCKMYYRCSTSLKAFVYICPGNSYFNENILKCSMIITPACQEQILKNSTSTVSPTTPAITTATATTPKPVTTASTSITTTTTTITATPATTTFAPTTTTVLATTTTTTTAVPSSTPFSCPMSGTFADPLSCKTYYRCALSGKIFQYVCPGNTYFNEFTKRCGLIMTPRCRNLIQA